MSVLGPGGSSGTPIFFAMLASSETFYHKCQKTNYPYKEYQPWFREKAEELNVKFDPSILKRLRNLKTVDWFLTILEGSPGGRICEDRHCWKA